MSAPAADQTGHVTIGAQLELDRLKQRENQLERVLQRLRDRARAEDACVVERTGLHRAVVDFADELAQIRQRLNDTHGQRRPSQLPEPEDQTAGGRV